MAIAFRAAANTSYAGGRTTTVCDKPTGTVSGDILVALIAIGKASSQPADPTPPAGWTQIGTATVINDGSFYMRGTLWWLRAGGSEGANYTWSHVSCSTQAAIACYSGCLASGTPTDGVSQTSYNTGGSGDIEAMTGITTTVASTMLIFGQHNWTGDASLTPPTGFTERFDGLVYLAEKAQATASASGSISQLLVGNHPWGAFLTALKPAAGTAYTLTAVAGSYAVTGTAATPKHGWKPAAAASSYALTGTNAVPTKLTPKSLVAGASSYALSGIDATFLNGRRLTAASSNYAMSGTDAALTYVAAGGAVPVFRAVANTTYGLRSLTTVDKPTGTVDGDVMIASLFIGDAVFGDVVLNAAPAGWTQIGTPTSVTQGDGGFLGKFWVFWKRASGEAASYDFTHPVNVYTQGAIVSYSGCITTGSPLDSFSQNFGTGDLGNTLTATGITTASLNTKLVLVGHNWNATGTLTPPSGMTERLDSLIYVADEDKNAAGASGDRTQTLSAYGPWQAYLLALMSGRVSTPYASPPINPSAFLPFLVR